METSLIKCLLPEEIMSLIFGYLEKEIDIKNCRSVCSNWNSRICSMYYNEGFQISLGEENYQKLEDDLLKFPELKMKIRKMNIICRTLDEYSDYDINLGILIPIIKTCSNLKKIRFQAPAPSNENYLFPLLTETVDLPCIEEIVTDELIDMEFRTRKTYLKINFKYRNTITSLNINDYEGNYSIYRNSYSEDEDKRPQLIDLDVLRPQVYGVRYERRWDEYPGLLNYVYSFRNLKVLKLLLLRIRDVIDITILTESNLLQLETLHICGEYSILYIENTPSHWSRLNSCGSVTELTLRARTISVNTLEYVMTYFTNVDRLNLIQKDLLENYTNSSYSEEETPALIMKLNSYCMGKEDADIFFKYDAMEGETQIRKHVIFRGGQLIDEIRQHGYYSSSNEHYNSESDYYDDDHGGYIDDYSIDDY
ncbi:uncharacterized protein EV154DRAFT_488320 [Mucor mucedo]|uniref:uncharacterized protein n=1 Tax=Mucor mucedo TaxID=29922 RepID=UPI00221FF93A|nr:uncharacterized protein EV154DRAFT_488320 [Mucor mucedo]KAI7867479.1 hypothetical protein EV154DRAFT_488320 [Mucor mucedo]